MMKFLTSGAGLISFGIQDSCCALSGTTLWHWLGVLDQLLPVPPMPPLHRGSSGPGTRSSDSFHIQPVIRFVGRGDIKWRCFSEAPLSVAGKHMSDFWDE